MQYTEFAPLPKLAPFLERTWTLEGHADAIGGEPQVVLPDGRTELVLHFGDAFERIDSAASVRQPWLLFAGQLTRQLVLRPTGAIGVVGLRFHPYGAAQLFDAPQHELAGRTPAVSELSAQTARLFEHVRGQAHSLAHGAELAQLALAELLDPSRIDDRVRYAVTQIEARHGLVSIDAIAADTGLTRRHLERRFKDVVGMTPKRLARIARFQRSLRILDAADPSQRLGGAETAAACGYADQAHFIRDFRDLAGCPPGEHLVTKGVLTGFFERR
jgi:AraC-like DNA-binding protein